MKEMNKTISFTKKTFSCTFKSIIG